MTAPTTLFRPFTRLVKITILDREFEVPENNTLLRCLQYLAPEQVSYGRFCWNEDCQYCRVTYDQGEGTRSRAALACKLFVEDGMRVTEVTLEIRYCMRGFGLATPEWKSPNCLTLFNLRGSGYFPALETPSFRSRSRA